MTTGKLFVEGFPFKFPGGETQVRITSGTAFPGEVVTFSKKVHSGDDIMEILLTVDALRRSGHKRLKLQLPYVPYGRQDRVMVPGEALGIKVFADLINSCNFEEVEIWDPHSDVTTALINNVRVVGQEELVSSTCWPQVTLSAEGRVPFKDSILVCPDAGARKKILKVAASLGKTEIVYADKVRNPATGQITGTSIDFGSIKHPGVKPSFLLVDDIGDGLRTFVELVKEMRTYTWVKDANIYLYVTHGFFSKGLDILDGLIDGVYTANLMSIDEAVKNHKLLKSK
jgi:ribose-phosphate pyrophosphokinase